MIVLTGDTTMLYCPKCRRTYEEGTRRFCENDGGRLLPAPSAKTPDSPPDGVFSDLLSQMPLSGRIRHTKPPPRFVPLRKTEETAKKLTSFPSAGRIFQSEEFLKPQNRRLPETEDSILELHPLPQVDDEQILELDLENRPAETKAERQKPSPRIVKPSEIPSGTALVGDRRTNPAGRTVLSRENADALLGQIVKGRYQVFEKLEDDDEESLIYLAEDQILDAKKVALRVFLKDDLGGDGFQAKILAEERVSLAHLNHPNIAGIFDSGELPQGNVFIVSEFVDGKSLAETLRQTGQLNSLRTARIVRQASYALSEAHQNGLLHRNLKPENIVLTISEVGIEQVKLMNLGVSRGEITDTNRAYKSPEEIAGGTSTFASDIYALAVIAYQMLTLRVPFGAESESGLLKAQKAGAMLPATDLRLDIQPLTDKILERALAFKPSERHPKAGDFGDAFFNALTAVSRWSNGDETEYAAEKSEVNEVADKGFLVVPESHQTAAFVEQVQFGADIHNQPKAELEGGRAEIAAIKPIGTPASEKRPPELPETRNKTRFWNVVLGIVLVLLAVWAVSRLSLNSPNQTEPNQNEANPTGAADTPVTPIPQDDPTLGEPDIKPPARSLEQPPNTLRFQNSRENLNGDLAKNFLGFNVFYPQDWIKAETPTNFLDIKRAVNGFPIEQMIVTRYESRGLMTLDRAAFPKLVETSNYDLSLKKNLGENFKVVSRGEATIQNGRWRVYEVSFQSWSLNEKGEKLTIWGKRLWLPVQSAGERNGFVITMLATSLSDVVTSADDVGTRGELATVLASFEPEQF